MGFEPTTSWASAEAALPVSSSRQQSRKRESNPQLPVSRTGGLPSTLLLDHSTQYRWLGSNQRPSPYEGDARTCRAPPASPEPTVGIEPTPTRYEGVAPPWSHVGRSNVPARNRTWTSQLRKLSGHTIPRDESRRVRRYRGGSDQRGSRTLTPFRAQASETCTYTCSVTWSDRRVIARQCTWRESNPHRPGANRPSSR